MAVNQVFEEGDNLSLPVLAGTIIGGSVKVGSLMGVALTNIATATDWAGGNIVGNATVATEGVFKFSVVGAVAAVGQPVYIVSADNTLTATVGANTLFGYALATQAGTGIIPVKISQV
jgi:predicted RecA/RadA family phage recombinase